jgi:hypothetical protein
VLNIFMPQVCLQSPGIASSVGLVKSTGMPQHVRVGFNFEPSSLCGPVNELLKVGHRHLEPANLEVDSRPTPGSKLPSFMNSVERVFMMTSNGLDLRMRSSGLAPKVASLEAWT